MDCSKTGLSGEKGCYQFMPSTWTAFSKDVYGYVPELTSETEEFVVREKVTRWLSSGLSDRQIFLIWNQGNAGQCKRGVNSHGVAYDSCEYAEKALQTLAKVIPSI